MLKGRPARAERDPAGKWVKKLSWDEIVMLRGKDFKGKIISLAYAITNARNARNTT